MITPSLKLNKATHAVTPLNDLMSAMYFKDPKFSFEENSNHNRHILGADNTLKNEVCFAVKVRHGLDIIGELRYGCVKRANGSNNNDAFSVISNNIKKERRPFNEIITTNPKVALRDAMKYFVPLTTEQISKQVRKAVDRCLEDTYSSVDPSYIRVGTAGEVLMFFVDLHRGGTPKIPPSVEKDMTQKVLDKIDNFSIIKDLRYAQTHQSGHAVELIDSGHVRVVDFNKEDSVIEADSIHALPEWMQLKISMLKMLEGTQGIRDVGCRFHHEGMEDKTKKYMYITDGEMTHLI